MLHESNPRTYEEQTSANLYNLQWSLRLGAQIALEQPAFASRTEEMARIVGWESSTLAAEATGLRSYNLQPIFTDAARDAAHAFATVFDVDGNKIVPEDAGAYRTAQDAAGRVALEHLPNLLATLELKGMDAGELVERATFNDALGVAGSILVQRFVHPEPETVKRVLTETVDETDFFRDRIDDLSLRQPSPESALDPVDWDRLEALEFSVRLANATWKAGQVHRAVWEGNTSRIDPVQREAFNPYDLLLRLQYDRLLEAGRPADEALIRVAFEVYKDIELLKQAV